MYLELRVGTAEEKMCGNVWHQQWVVWKDLKTEEIGENVFT